MNLDVRPAKKDNQSSGNAGNPNAKQIAGSNNQFNSMNNQYNNANESFGLNKPNYVGGMNQNFGNDNTFGNQKDLNVQARSGGNFDDGSQVGNNDNDQFNGKHNNGNDHFNPTQNRGNNQFNMNNSNRGNDQFITGPGNQNRGTNNQFGNNNQMGNQNRPGGTPGNRNQANPGNSQNVSGVTGGAHRARGTRGGKNRNKNNQNNPNNPNINNFRDRSPINRNNRMEDKTNRDWDLKQGDRLRGNFGRDSFNDSGNRYDDFKTSGTRETNANFG